MIVLGTLVCRGWGSVICPPGLVVLPQEPKLVPSPARPCMGTGWRATPLLQLHGLLQDRQGYHRNQLQPFPAHKRGHIQGIRGRIPWEQLFARIFLCLEQVESRIKRPSGSPGDCRVLGYLFTSPGSYQTRCLPKPLSLPDRTRTRLKLSVPSPQAWSF